MLIFPLVYFSSLIYSLNYIFKKKYEAILVFFIFGLPIYITSLSILHLYGWDILIPAFQYSKEIIVITSISLILYELNDLPEFNLLDKLMALFLGYSLLYIIMPLGSYTIFQKFIAFKNIAFFPLIYFIGRLINIEKIWIEKIKVLISIMSIFAGIVLLGEIINYKHLQTITGFADYNYRYMGASPGGNYGLSWTFEIEGGIKRFASFFANPLENAAATLLTVGILLSNLNNRTKSNYLFYTTLISAILSIMFALSRASFASFLIVFYIYFKLTKNKKMLFAFHVSFGVIIVGLIYFLANHSISEFIFNTFDFSNTSSVSHLIEWIDGVQSIYSHPLGIGLGESGRVSGELGLNTGGENQLIITGVQIGLIGLGLYIAIIVMTIKWSLTLFKYAKGKGKALGTILLIFRIGMIIPMLTAAVESYLYISFVGWFLTGCLSTAHMKNNEKIHWEGV